MEGTMNAPRIIPGVSISSDLSPGAIRVIGFENPMVTIVQKTLDKVVAVSKYIPDTPSFQDQNRKDLKPTSVYANEISYEERDILFNDS